MEKNKFVVKDFLGLASWLELNKVSVQLKLDSRNYVIGLVEKNDEVDKLMRMFYSRELNVDLLDFLNVQKAFRQKVAEFQRSTRY